MHDDLARPNCPRCLTQMQPDERAPIESAAWICPSCGATISPEAFAESPPASPPTDPDNVTPLKRRRAR